MAFKGSRLLLNSGMNVLGGASAALVTFCVPPILARHLPELEYALWNLVLPIVAYITIFGSGIHLAIAKFISHSTTTGPSPDRERTIRAAFAITSGSALVALCVVGLIALLYPHLYPKIPQSMLGDFRSSLLWIGGSAALQLLALVPLGIFTGHQQNYYYVGAQVAVRALMLGTLWWQATLHTSLINLAFTYAVSGFLLLPCTYGVLFRSHRYYLSALTQLADWARIKQLLAYCATFSVWSLAELLINSIDTILVGRVDMFAVNPYALSLTLITVFSGLMHALVSPLLPGISALSSSPEGLARLPALLNRATFWTSLFVQTILIGFFFLGQPFLDLYAAHYAKAAYPFLAVLFIASILRQISLPYGIFLLSTSLHGKAGFAVLVEGVVNLIASLWLSHTYGAIGVAWGTVVGAFAGKAVFCLHTFAQTRILVPSTRAFLFHGFLKPFLCLSPAYAFVIFWLSRATQ